MLTAVVFLLSQAALQSVASPTATPGLALAEIQGLHEVHAWWRRRQGLYEFEAHGGYISSVIAPASGCVVRSLPAVFNLNESIHRHT